MSLDRFLPPVAVKTVEEKCEDCGRKISFKEPKYKLKIKGKVAPYCQECASKRLPKPKQPEQPIEEGEEE